MPPRGQPACRVPFGGERSLRRDQTLLVSRYALTCPQIGSTRSEDLSAHLRLCGCVPNDEDRAAAEESKSEDRMQGFSSLGKQPS